MFLTIGIVLVVLGFVLILRSCRGRVVGDEPYCGRCDFDLRGRTPLPETCPECGRGLPGNVRRGRRVRSRRRLGIGIALALFGAAFVTADLNVDRTTFLKSAPDWWLTGVELRVLPESRIGPVLDELDRRRRNGDLPSATVLALARDGLERHRILARTAATDAQPFAGWRPVLGSMIAEAIHRDLLAPDETAAFLRGSLIVTAGSTTSDYAGEAMPHARVGHVALFPFDLVMADGSPGPSWSLEVDQGPLIIGSRQLMDRGGSSTATFSLTSTGSSTSGPILRDSGLPPGTHAFTMVLELSVKGVAEWTERISGTMVVRAADVVRDEAALVAAARGMLRNLRLRTFRADPRPTDDDQGSAWLVRLDLDIDTDGPLEPFDLQEGELITRSGRRGSWQSSSSSETARSMTWRIEDPPAGPCRIELDLYTIVCRPPGVAGTTGPVRLRDAVIVLDDLEAEMSAPAEP